MAGRIPQQFIDEILARTDIVDLIDGFVPLKKAGKDFQACCPFHDEKTPSFTVSQNKQFYHCFGCGVNGTAISFLMDYRHLEFPEAIEELANKAGVPVPKEVGSRKSDGNLMELYELLEMVVRFYCTQLKEHPSATRAVDYLKQRGISGELARQFELGYAPAGWDNLIQNLGQSEAAQERLSKTGMIIRRDNGGYYDRFRDRIMFPIRDQRGRVIGFGGRVLDDDTPKYLNSPETPIYHKGRELYGLYNARQNNKDLQSLYVVEGYMDVIALAQYGIQNAVASLGTATTSDHLERLFRTCPRVIFCFDGDRAGKKAAEKAMEIALPLLQDGRQVFFKFLPEGMDPDDYVRAEGAEKFIGESELTSLSDYLLNISRDNADLGSAEGSSLFMKNISPRLEALPAGVFRTLIIEQIARLTGLKSENIDSAAPASISRKNRPRLLYQQSSAGMTKVSWLIAMLLKQPDLALLAGDSDILEKSHLPGIDTLLELVATVKERPDISTAQILERWRDTRFSKRFHELSSQQILNDENINLKEEFLSAIASIKSDIDTPLEEARNVSLQQASPELKARLRDLQKSIPED